MVNFVIYLASRRMAVVMINPDILEMRFEIVPRSILNLINDINNPSILTTPSPN